MTRRQERINSLLKKLTSSFLKSNINPKTMVTVIRVEISSDLRLAKIFFSVFPEDKESETLRLLKEKEREFKNFLKSKIKMKFLPSVFFEIDREAKMERRIEELLKN